MADNIQLPSGYQDAQPISISLPAGYQDARPAKPLAEFQKPPLNLKENPNAPDQNSPQGVSEEIKQHPFRALQIPAEAAAQGLSDKRDAVVNKMLQDAANYREVSKLDYVKAFGLGAGSDLFHMAAGATSPEGISTALATALVPEVMGPALAAHGAVTMLEHPSGVKSLVLRGSPEEAQAFLSGASELTGGLAVTGHAYQSDWQASRSRLQRLTGAMQTPQQASQMPYLSKLVPARAVSNMDVINMADADGIDLTPGQATRERAAQFIQGRGESTIMPGGQELQDALELNKGKLQDEFENMMHSQDPNGLGSTTERAGASLKANAEAALKKAKTDANIAYKQAGLDSAGIKVSGLRNQLAGFVDTINNPSFPDYQTPAVKSFLSDMEEKIKDELLGPDASVQSARNLRTELWEKGNDFSGNIPDSARALYKQASEVVDDAMMDAAKGTKFEQSFRAASAKWKALKATFDTPGEPLNNLLQSQDSKAAYNGIVANKSADVISKLKAQNIDLAPVRSQVIQDIAGKNFRVTGRTLAGYPDSFLQELFGPQATHELYVRSEIARRLGLEVNPSGSGRFSVAAKEMGWNPMNWAKGETAARVSMPRKPTSFVSPTLPPSGPGITSRFAPATAGARALAGSQGAGIVSPITGGQLATPADLFKRSENSQ